MKLTQIITLGRSLDFEFPSNRAIAVIALALVIGGGVFSMLSGDADLLAAVQLGVGWGLAAFFAWALGRELYPDHPAAALIAATVAAVGLPWAGTPNLLALFWLLLLIRLVNRTVGRAPTVFDLLVILLLTVWLTFVDSWIFGLLAWLALYQDMVFSARSFRQFIWITIPLLLAVVAFTAQGKPVVADLSQLMLWAAFAVAAGLLTVGSLTMTKDSVADATGEPLDPKRVAAGQWLAVVTGVVFGVFHGLEGVAAWLPLWAAMLGVVADGLWVYARTKAGADPSDPPDNVC